MTTTRLITAKASHAIDYTAAPLPHRRECRQDVAWEQPGRAAARFFLACSALLTALTTLVPAPVSAGSFRIYDHSASATGQASAFTAQADDASAADDD